MDTLAVFCIVAVAFTGLTIGSGVLPDGPLPAAVGGSVRFETAVTPTATPFLVVTWTFIDDTKETPIITAMSKNITSPEFEGRITLFIQTGSLELSKLTRSDSGKYRVGIITDGGNQITGSTTLQTFVPVSNVMLTANATDLVEFNNTVSLSCFSSGSSLSFQWLNGSGQISADDRVQITDGGATLTINPVTRVDHGLFRCRVSNAVSEGTSHSVRLSVSYGPDDTYLKVSPSQDYIAEGSNVILSCSAASRPQALFTWFVDGKELPSVGSILSLMNIQQSQSGNYSCRSLNNRTLRRKRSQPSAIKVLIPVSNVMLTANATDLVEFNNTVSLSCFSSGSSLSFQWLNGSGQISADDRVQITDGGATLTINPVTRVDHGLFRCRVSNAVSEGTSHSVRLSVSYGPDPVQITGPSRINAKQTLTLTCFAASFPSAAYTWMLLNHIAELHNSSTFVKSNIDFSDSGSYICRASNNITGKNMSAVHTLTVTVETVATCSAGCIAGIVVACLVICAAATGGGYYIYHKRKQSKNGPNRNTSIRTGGKGQDNTAETKHQELNYADLTIIHTNDSGTVHQDLQDNQTEYAKVRVNNGPPSYDAHMGRMKRRAPQPQDAQGGRVCAEVHSNEPWYCQSRDQSVVGHVVTVP
ncbi:carcinoembryonic antigen-related cell adhesion molecule 1-like [Phycodurus eques]|uniref:carcinoembryonic antigen-related cell adhesion molecule 1-like n=1 Tax=Phycodurus eques TaxID=693459 RepID=UPI002ACD3E42|nr:carcinoembryonic antigen-related cell adhesion molecule 1-like [Phycodurus eques]